jgi:hypothetical protein
MRQLVSGWLFILGGLIFVGVSFVFIYGGTLAVMIGWAGVIGIALGVAVLMGWGPSRWRSR